MGRAEILNGLLDGVSRKELAARAAKQSLCYRGGGTSQGIEDEADALAYVLARAPATQAVAAAVLRRAMEVMGDFAPASLLDVGAGPGSASWAAAEAWPEIAATMLDRNAALRALAAKLMPEATILAGDLSSPKPACDLVMANYVLAEFPVNAVARIARDLWESANQMLVLIEPGTPDGFARIRAARAALIEAGAHVAAPCTHDNVCPMSGTDWCHFSQRVARSRDHLILKDAHVPFEDERYSYVVVTREPKAKGARIIKPVIEAKPGITLPLCDGNGLRDEFVARRDRGAFKRARKLAWGDVIGHPPHPERGR